MVISAVNDEHGLVEVVELPSHPFFIACQYHPEFQSRPNSPHPLFSGLVQAAFYEEIKNPTIAIVQTSSAPGIFCPNCGNAVAADSAFCPNCGNKLN